MSLLLDALKKAAEKNERTAASQKNEDVTKVELTKTVDKTEVADRAEVSAEKNKSDPSFDTNPDSENVTEMELAQIIKAQKVVSSDDTVIEEAIVGVNKPKEGGDTLTTDSDPSLSLAMEDEDPSLKLALSDEEILLTDDDVTEFLGGDEIASRFEDLSLLGNTDFIKDDETEMKLVDSTTSQSLNLKGAHTEFNVDSDDTTTGLGLTSTISNSAQTTNLNNLTNDATLSVLDRTSTQTFASDNYDRTLVKLDDDVSKVFTGMKSAKSGAAMTPDFAKKVFVHKSTSLRRQNYKLYGVISFVLLVVISVLALFEMQSQIDGIDTSLVRLKVNPVPSELRFKRKEQNDDDLAVLEGRVDTQALALLRSLTEQSKQAKIEQENPNVVKQEAAVQKNLESDSKNISASQVNEPELEKVNADSIKVKDVVEKQKNVVLQKKPKQVAVKAKAIKKQTINIETKTVISEESVWLKEAFSAFEKGNLELAAKKYNRVLAKNASNRDALLGQAAIFVSQNKNNRAIDNYQAILLKNPKDSLAMTSLIAASTLSPVESESRLKLLQRESPEATYLQFALGNVVSAQSRWQEAQQYYYSAYQAEPKNPDYAYNLAVSLEQINKPDVAINYYSRAIENAQTMPASFDLSLTQQRIEVLSK